LRSPSIDDSVATAGGFSSIFAATHQSQKSTSCVIVSVFALPSPPQLSQRSLV
jgi:hypothetical protein